MNTLRTLMTGILMLMGLITVPVIALAALDTTQPTTSATLTGTKGSDGWYTTSVTMTLAAADGTDGSGVAKTEYSLDNVTWLTYSVPFVLDKDGDQYVYFRSTDLAGNVETPAKSQEIRINKNGLVGWWKMDGNWKDSSVVGNDGTPYNGATFSPDAKVGTQAGSFSPNSYVSVYNNASLKLTSTMTLSAWINPGDTTNYRQIVSNFAYGGYAYQMGLAPTGKLRIDVSKDGTSYECLISSTSPISANTWQHVAATFNNGALKLYVNGVEIASNTTTFSILNSKTSVPLTIGRSPDNIQYFKGLIDEVLIYNRVLSPTDIQGLYRNFAVRMPTINNVPSTTASATLALSGTKPANTAIVVNGNTLVPLDGSTSWMTSYPLSQGTNTIAVTAQDNQELSSLPVSRTVILDTTPPRVITTTPANNVILKPAPLLVTFTMVDAVSPLDYAATLNGAAVKNASGYNVSGTWISSGSGTSGSVTFTPTSTLADGTYTFVIKPTDALANGSTYTLTFTVDSTPPSAPEINPIPKPINTNSKTITGTMSSDSNSVVVSCAGATIDTISYPTATTWSVTVSGLSEGSNTIAASAVDAVGNQSGTTMATIIVDTTSPAVGATPAEGIYASAQSVVLTTNEQSAIYYTLDGSTPTVSAMMYSQPIPIPASATLKYFARDLAGNTSEIKTEKYVIDTTPPVLTVSTLSDGAFTNNEILNIAGTVTDDTEVKGVTVNDVPVPVNPDGSFSYALVLKSGTNVVTTVATDRIGNRSSDTRSINLDQTAPALVITTPADNSKAASALLTVSGVVDETSSVQVRHGDTVQSAIQTGNAFSAYVTLVSGYNTIEITAADLAGNQSSLKRTVLYDDEKPSLSIIDPNQDMRTNQGLTIKGTVHDTLTAVGVTISKDNEIFTPQVIDGKFEQALNFTEEKTYDIVVTATNEVGTSTSVQRNVIYDITPPALGIDPITSPTSQQSLSVTGIRETGTPVAVTCATATVSQVSYPSATTWRVNISGLNEGENVVTAASADAAGNVFKATATVVLISKLPEITIAATPDVIWPPNHKMVPVTITGGVETNGSVIKSVAISVSDEYKKFEYNSLTFGSTVMLEAWRKGNDKDGRKYTITVVVTDMGGGKTVKTALVTVPHDKPKLKKTAPKKDKNRDN